MPASPSPSRATATRTPVIAGNWKMHKTVAESLELATALKNGVAAVRDVEVVIAPAFTALHAVAQRLEGSRVALAAQDCFWEDQGAWTGAVSVKLLADVGCRYIIVGHSERRQHFGETDAAVNLKAKAVLKHGLGPIVCIGETLREREGGNTLPVIERQVRDGLAGFSRDVVRGLTIAYEPVWAIGTGKTATPEQAQEVHAAIRTLLKELAGEAGSETVRVLYGGSVKADNIDTLMAQPDIDGAFVGGASLDAAAFSRIISFR